MGFPRLLYRVARRLRYRPLPGLLQKTVTIPSVEVVTTTVQHAFNLCTPARPARFEGMMAKYGLLDLEFGAPDLEFTLGDRGGVPLLKELGWFEQGDADEDSWLDSLETGFTAHPIIKLFLETKGGEELNPDRLELRVGPGYLPRQFTVVDACATNCGMVWFARHFYL